MASISAISSAVMSTTFEFSITLSVFLPPGMGMMVGIPGFFDRQRTQLIANWAMVQPFFSARLLTCSASWMLTGKFSGENLGELLRRGSTSSRDMNLQPSNPRPIGEYLLPVNSRSSLAPSGHSTNAISGIPYWAHASATPFVSTLVVIRLSSTSTAQILVTLTARWIVSARTSERDMQPMIPVCTNSLSRVSRVGSQGVSPSPRATSNRSIIFRPFNCASQPETERRTPSGEVSNFIGIEIGLATPPLMLNSTLSASSGYLAKYFSNKARLFRSYSSRAFNIGSSFCGWEATGVRCWQEEDIPPGRRTLHHSRSCSPVLTQCA